MKLKIETNGSIAKFGQFNVIVKKDIFALKHQYTIVRSIERPKNMQQGRFADAGRADNCNRFSNVKIGMNALQNINTDTSVFKTFCQVFHAYQIFSRRIIRFSGVGLNPTFGWT